MVVSGGGAISHERSTPVPRIRLSTYERLVVPRPASPEHSSWEAAPALVLECLLQREFKVPWREAGTPNPPNHLGDKVDSDQEVVNKEVSLCSLAHGLGAQYGLSRGMAVNEWCIQGARVEAELDGGPPKTQLLFGLFVGGQKDASLLESRSKQAGHCILSGHGR